MPNSHAISVSASIRVTWATRCAISQCAAVPRMSMIGPASSASASLSRRRQWTVNRPLQAWWMVVHSPGVGRSDTVEHGPGPASQQAPIEDFQAVEACQTGPPYSRRSFIRSLAAR